MKMKQKIIMRVIKSIIIYVILVCSTPLICNIFKIPVSNQFAVHYNYWFFSIMPLGILMIILSIIYLSIND